MTKSRALKWLCASAVVGGLSVYAFNPVVGADESDDADTALVESARKAFQAAQLTYENDMAPLDDLYRWSRRVMQAELRANPSNKQPKLDHLKRMSEIHKKIAALFQAGAKGGDVYKYESSAYYVEAAKSEFVR